jgi:hypothetical protein
MARKVSDMSNLVLLSGERGKREKADQKKLIIGLKELLARAEFGELKALCYASIDSDGQNVTLGKPRGQSVGRGMIQVRIARIIFLEI